VWRCTPCFCNCPFDNGTVLFLAFHVRCRSQSHTNALGVLVARAACSAHRSGTMTNGSARFRFGVPIGVECFNCNPASVPDDVLLPVLFHHDTRLIAPTVSSTDMMVRHIFWATGRLSQ
jgi:hypothetical protein